MVGIGPPGHTKPRPGGQPTRIDPMSTEDTQLALALSKLVSCLEGNANGVAGESREVKRLLRSVGHLGDLARVSPDLQAEGFAQPTRRG